MEFDPKLVRGERILAAALLAVVLAAAALERCSDLAAAVREGRPWTVWLCLGEGRGKGSFFWTLYQPARRTLDLVYVPASSLSAAEAKVSGFLPDQGADEAPALRAATPAWPDDQAPAAARAWLRGGAWALRQGREGAGSAVFDRLLLALELGRLAPRDIRTAWLPEESLRAAYFARLLSAAPEASDHPVTVEILNASSRKGLASEATKVLRSKGADVVSFGNVASPEPRSVVYDRTGRYENAAAVRKMLGCPAAEAVTQVNPKRLVDVSVVLSEDCAQR